MNNTGKRRQNHRPLPGNAVSALPWRGGNDAQAIQGRPLSGSMQELSRERNQLVRNDHPIRGMNATEDDSRHPVYRGQRPARVMSENAARQIYRKAEPPIMRALLWITWKTDQALHLLDRAHHRWGDDEEHENPARGATGQGAHRTR